MGGLNIKDDHIHALVKQLAAMKGTSLTAAVKLAVASEIEREKARQDAGGRPARKRSEVLLDFAHEFARRGEAGGDLHSWDIDKLLYDEKGLPK